MAAEKEKGKEKEAAARPERYEEFMARVKRTVYLDNLSPQDTEAVIKAAFEQYGTVINVQLIPNYTDSFYGANSALAEMESAKHADNVIKTVKSIPFMMSGMPRPVRACKARPEMFDDRPAKPGRKIQISWLDPKGPDFEVAQKLKELTKEQFLERQLMLKKQLEDEEELSQVQAETLKGQYQKYEMMQTLFKEGHPKRLATVYGVNVSDVGFG